LILARPGTPDWMAISADATVLDRRLIAPDEWATGVSSRPDDRPLLLIDADGAGAGPRRPPAFSRAVSDCRSDG
jgi:hypothetical protein